MYKAFHYQCPFNSVRLPPPVRGLGGGLRPLYKCPKFAGTSVRPSKTLGPKLSIFQVDLQRYRHLSAHISSERK